MKDLLVYIKDYKKESLLGPFFKLLEAIFELLVPLVMAGIIDYGIAGSDTGYIVRMSLLLVLLGFVGLVCSVTAQYFAAKASVGFVTKLKHALFAHIQTLSFSELDECGTSTLITRMTSDMNQVQSGVNLTLRLLLRSPFIVFGAMIMAFTIDVKSALIFVVTIPVLSVVVFGIMLVSIPLYKKVQAQLDRVLGLTRENLTGVRVIRAFCMEEEEARIFHAENDKHTSIQTYVGRISALMNPVTYVIINVAIVVLLWKGAIRVDNGTLTQGMVIALYNYMSQILVELVKLANLIINLTKSVACGNRINEIFKIKSSIKPEADTVNDYESDADIHKSENIVEFKDVSFSYAGSMEESLTSISFSAKQGETIGIIGGTGSGKSTLVNMIPRFYDATSGEIYVNGRNVKNYELQKLRDVIGIVPQKAVLFKGTIRSNMLWGKNDATDEEMYESFKLAQATEVVNNKEDRLDSEVHQEGRNFSGGQRQRLTIARALIKRPEILILDDSSSALDFVTEAGLRKALRTLNYNPTIFIVAQRTSSIQHADKIIVLEDGNMVGVGNHDELLSTCEVYKEIYNSQFKKEGR